MTHKINPYAYRLSIKSSWLSSYNFRIDNWIRKLINGTFIAFNYFSSPCILVHSLYYIKILVVIYDNSFDKKPRFSYIISFLKSVLEKKFNKKIVFIVRETKNKNFDAKILGDWIAFNIQKQPNKLKLLDKFTFNFN